MKKSILTILALASLLFFLFALNMMLELAENISSLFNIDQAIVSIIFLVLFLGIVLLPLLSTQLSHLIFPAGKQGSNYL